MPPPISQKEREAFLRALKAWKEHKGWTAQQCAAHLGVSVRTFESWESGRFTPSDFARDVLLRRMRTGGPKRAAAATT